MLQMPEILAHSSLIVGIDNNYLTTFVPYVSQNSEEEKLKDKLPDECQ